MTHRLNMFLLFLAALVGLPFYWLMLSNPARDVAPHPISIPQLRKLAGQMPGARPIAVEVIHVGWKRIPSNIYAAGSGMKRRQFAVLAYRLVVPGSGGIVIDSGVTAHLGKAMGLEKVLASRQNEVERWMQGAEMIFATNERPLHLGGMALFAGRRDAAVPMAHARLNQWQVPGETADDHIPWPATLVLRPAITAARPVAVAPGVVVIPTGDPTPGSQMIYVRLADMREYLFAGDLVPFEINATELRVRSNLLDWSAAPGLRSETMRWLVTARAMKRQAPKMVIVPAHDVDWLANPLHRTGVRFILSREEMQKPAGI